MELKELKDLLKVLRQNGVTQFNTPDISLTLSDTFEKKSRRSEPEVDLDEESEWDRLSDEDKMLWSAKG